MRDFAQHCATRRPRPSAAGYTIVEVMIVVGIIGIVAATGMLFFRGQMPRHRVQDAADRLQSQMRAARLHAISRVRPVALSLDLANKRLRTEVDENGNGTVESNEVATVTLSTAAGLALAATATSGTFTPRGDFTTSNGYWRVTVTHAGANDQFVYVFQAGHVQASEIRLD